MAQQILEEDQQTVQVSFIILNYYDKKSSFLHNFFLILYAMYLLGMFSKSE